MTKLNEKQTAALQSLREFRAPNGVAKMASAAWLGHETSTMNQLVAKGLATKVRGNCFAYFRAVD